MTGEIIVPPLGESITEATVARWVKKVGDYVEADEPLVELETDKVTLEVNAPLSGYIGEIFVPEGTGVAVGSLLGMIQLQSLIQKPLPRAENDTVDAGPRKESAESRGDFPLSPAVRKMVADYQLDPVQIPASGKDGRLTKGDILTYLEGSTVREIHQDTSSATYQDASSDLAQDIPRAEQPRSTPSVPTKSEPSTEHVSPHETRVRMSRLRQRIAQRLKEAQNTAAILTTFNEIDMSQILSLRERYKEAFEKKHGVRLGMMSFFVKAAVDALKEFPAVNAVIEGDEIVYKHTYDIGVAVGTDQGLVVPVIRHAENLSFAGIEQEIANYGQKARQGQLKIEDLTGGTFTISNGGVYGSLMSTPILNPPQSAILGMHKTEKRPIVGPQDQIIVRPMMYVALSYDHRIIDGKEAVGFLVRIKEKTENPERLLLDL